MKKTIIAIVALSGVSMGITLDDLTYTAGNASTTTEDGTFSYVLTLDVADLRGLLEKGQTQAWGTKVVEYSAGGTATGIVVNGGSSNNKVNTSSLYAKWGDNNAWGNFMSTGSDTSIDLADLNGDAEGTGWDDVVGAAITYTFDLNNGTKGALTLIGLNDTVIINHITTLSGLKTASATGAAISFGDMVTGYYYSNNVLSEADSKEVSKLAAIASIPEPTTATLSLLALAGLAARRRRR